MDYQGGQEMSQDPRQYWQAVAGSMERIRVPGGWAYKLDATGAAFFVPLAAIETDREFDAPGWIGHEKGKP